MTSLEYFQALHPTFEIHPCVPTDEFNEVKEINCISRIAESSGLTHIIPSLVALRNVSLYEDTHV